MIISVSVSKSDLNIYVITTISISFLLNKNNKYNSLVIFSYKKKIIYKWCCQVKVQESTFQSYSGEIFIKIYNIVVK